MRAGCQFALIKADLGAQRPQITEELARRRIASRIATRRKTGSQIAARRRIAVVRRTLTLANVLANALANVLAKLRVAMFHPRTPSVAHTPVTKCPAS